MAKTLLPGLLFFGLGTAPLWCATNVPWVISGGSVRNTPGRVVMTQNVNFQFGSMWNPCTISMNSSWSLSFNMNFGTRACGADGISFVLQPGAIPALGSNSGMHGADGIVNSLEIGFDTYTNTVGPYFDPPYDSVNLQTGGNAPYAEPLACGGPGPAVSGTCGRPPISSTLFNIKDGLDHAVDIAWNAATFTITLTVDGSLRATWTFASNVVATVFGGNPNVYYGFTAGTGGAYNWQQAEQTSPYLCPNPTFTPAAAVTPLIVPTNDCGTATPMPTLTSTKTVTPYQSPTQTLTPYPPGCGPPVFQQAGMIMRGCLGSPPAAPGPFTFTYNITAAANEVLIIRMENTANSNSGTISSVTYAGAPMTLQGSVYYAAKNVNIVTYYMANPPAGPQTFSFMNTTTGCNWNIAAEVYRNVDVAAPLGAYNSSQSGLSNASKKFTLSMTTTGPASLVSVFMASDQANNGGADIPVSDPGQVSLALPTASMACCEGVYGDYKPVGGPGTYTLGYTLNQASRYYFAAPVEVMGAACSSPTATNTSNITDTYTPSATPTRSPTPSASPTASPTLTWSPSPTASPTRSFSPTATPSATQSVTPTYSATLTASPTVTLSFTQSDTKTASPTPTMSFTNSPVFTPTMTPTWSPTLTISPSFTITQTPTDSASPTPTWSPSLTLSNTPTPTDSASPTPTWSPSNTFSPSPTPSPTKTATLTPTVTATFSATPTPSLTPSITVTFSVSPTQSPSPTITETAVKAPFLITVGAYNEAGELVKLIFSGQAQNLPNSLGVAGSALISSGGSLPITLGLVQSGGIQYSATAWDLTNDTGQGVGGGVYYIKAEYKDPYGKVTTLNEAMQVLNTDAENSLTIFNSAGEEVRHQKLNGLLPDIVDIGLPKPSFAPLYDSYGNTTNGALSIIGKDYQGGIHSLDWDGKNDLGLPVASGTYQIVLVRRGRGGAKTVVARSATMIFSGSSTSLAGARIAPSPLMKGDLATIFYPPTPGLACAAQLYNLAGEAVAWGADPSGSGSFSLKVGQLSAGIYLCRLEKLYGAAVKARSTLKFAIVK